MRPIQISPQDQCLVTPLLFRLLHGNLTFEKLTKQDETKTGKLRDSLQEKQKSIDQCWLKKPNQSQSRRRE